MEFYENSYTNECRVNAIVFNNNDNKFICILGA